MSNTITINYFLMFFMHGQLIINILPEFFTNWTKLTILEQFMDFESSALLTQLIRHCS